MTDGRMAGESAPTVKPPFMIESRKQEAQKSTAVPGDIVQGDGQTIERVLLALCKAFDIDSTEHKTLRDTIEAIRRKHYLQTAQLSENVAAPVRAEMQPVEMPPRITREDVQKAARSKYFTEYLDLVSVIPPEKLAAPASFELLQVCIGLAVFLMEKNIAYGDSALNPLRAISKADPVEQIRVRMDDKLSRLIRGQAAGEDALKDLVGYWVLLQVLEKRNGGT